MESPSPSASQSVQAHAPGSARCGNCEAVLTGPFCAQCGQHAHASARNLAAVVHDAWHDLTHVDGRLWHSLWLLLVRPGGLSVEYFREHRARFLPPVRLYLVISLVFFALNVGATHHKAKHGAAAAAAAGATATAPPAAKAGGATTANPGGLLSFDADVDADTVGDGFSCEKIRAFAPSIEQALREECVNIQHEGADAFLATLAHNVPKMMFVFLPMVAAAMLLLYWWPRRYYVEHLVLLLHNHSALFLSFVLLDSVALLARHLPAATRLLPIAGVIVFCYVLWYPYAAMRRYYAQGRALTLAKFGAIAMAYLLCLLLTLLGTAVVTAVQES